MMPLTDPTIRATLDDSLLATAVVRLLNWLYPLDIAPEAARPGCLDF